MGTIAAILFTTHLMCTASPTQEEMAEAQRWVSTKFAGATEAATVAAPSLEVLANNDALQLNARGGKPMHLADKEFVRGIYAHAPSSVRVRLPKPAKTFHAVVGVDFNEQTSGGRGSVVFSVRVGDVVVWKSDLLREGMTGAAVDAPLGEATEFFLEVSDGGDGISCDQADWADTRVTYADNDTAWLGEFPITEHARTPYTTDPIFSFNYSNKESREFLSSWSMKRTKKQLDDVREQHVTTYQDPHTKLLVRCEAIAYRDFPTVEWTVHFKNEGNEDTPIVSDIHAIDAAIERSQASEFVLHHHTGDNCAPDSYEPHETPLPAGSAHHAANAGGRPTQHQFPYFNIQSGAEGWIFVVSWAGQWNASFARDSANGLQLSAGQEKTHFILHAGEEARTPMIVMQFWKGDSTHAHNVWRSWMIAHNMPRPGGKLPPVPLLAACSSHQFGEMIHANSESQMFFVDKYLERGIMLDYWWMDAGWYVQKNGWPQTGTWEVDTNRFPGGLRPITDHIHKRGLKSIVWFEPERVAPDTWLSTEHPEWIYGGKKGGLLKLGEPEVRSWLTEHVDTLLREQGIDLYRQDFNMDPLQFWRDNDAEDRQGITENKHVAAYFAYWDELLRRHPDMLIDSCASGGRRNDLETLRRAVPLLRSDYIMEPVGNQCHTYELSLWFPFYGTGTSKTDTYLVRSVLCPNFIACWDMRDENLDYANLKKVIDQWKEFAPNFMGDYYPLTPYSLANDQWIAWQFHRPEVGQGMIQAFRRADSVYESARLRLFGLDATARYHVTDMDGVDAEQEGTGSELMTSGLVLSLKQRPQAAVYTYKRL